MQGKIYAHDEVTIYFNAPCHKSVFGDMFRRRLRWLRHEKSGKAFLEVTSDRSYGHVTIHKNGASCAMTYTLSRSKAERLGLQLGKRYFMRRMPTRQQGQELYVFDEIQAHEPHVRFVSPVMSVSTKWRTVYTKAHAPLKYVPIAA